jgi:hypothetical protein
MTVCKYYKVSTLILRIAGTELYTDVWRLQNLNEKEQIRKFFYGLVCGYA